MRLRNISIFFIVGIAFVNLLVSCNDSETETIATTLSADAQIYSFSARSIPRTAEDTLNYPYLANVKFAIDQSKRLIYNVDSLPHGFTVRKIAASFVFSNQTASQVIYPNDSIVDWASATDSIDFMIYPMKDPSLNNVPQVKFKVTAQNGTAPYDYTIKLLIHQVDPDSITWRKEQNLPASGATKVLLVDNKFYSFVDNSGTLNLYTSDKSTINWANNTVSGLSASALNTITYSGDSFYASDATNVYKSTDGLSWSSLQAYTGMLIGALPDAETGANYGIVAVRNSGTDIYLDYLDENGVAVAGKEVKVGDSFPLEGYSVVYDQRYKMLLVTGGKKKDGKWTNSTWLIEYRENKKGEHKLRVQEVYKGIPFAGAEGTVSFLYDNKLYAWGQDKETSAFMLYKSDLGMEWEKAENKEYFDPKADKVKGQSIIVDSDNYIWTFGGELTSSYSNQVWRGRMNRLNK